MLSENQFLLTTSCPGVSLSDSEALYNKPGLPLLVIDNAWCQAVIAPQGAHLVEFNRKSADGSPVMPLLWLSPGALFTGGKAIRGGIPVCFPWFGPHPQDPTAPQHGLARTRDWLLTRAAETSDATELVFALQSSEDTLRVYPHAFCAELRFKLGKTLTIELTVHNEGDSAMPVGWALHSYFPVTDTAQAIVPELVGREYLDKTDEYRRKQLVQNLDFSQLTDAVFVQSPDKISLLRPEGSLLISCVNAPTTIVWNPNVGANSIADLGSNTYKEFVCVERGVAFDDCWQLAAGESVSARMEIDQGCPV